MNAEYLEKIGYERESRQLLEAEVLSACMINPEWLNTLDLTTHDFTGDHGAIYSAMLEQHADGEPVDTVTIWKKTGVSPSRLATIVNVAATSANLPYYCKQLKERIFSDAKRREADKANDAIRSGGDHQAALSEMNSAIEAEKARLIGEGQGQDFASVVAGIIQRIRNGEIDGSVLHVNIPWLDRLSKGLAAGDYIILAARPSCGKTALLIQILTELSIRGHRSLFFSKEMSDVKIGLRTISYCAMANANDILRGNGDQSGRETILDIEQDIRRVAQNIKVFSRGITVDSVEREMRSAAAAGYEVVGFDYIQLMECGNGRSRNSDIEGFSRRVKTVLNETGLRGIFLSQLSRECEKDNRAPRMSDLRDSGSIEQDADGVWFLHRKDKFTFFNVAKGRDTGIGGTTLLFDGQRQRFAEVER